MIEYNITNDNISANIVCTQGDYSNSIHLNLTSWNSTGDVLNGSKDCYATSWIMDMTEEDKDENIGDGTGFLQFNVDRIYDNIKASQGVKDTLLFLEFSSDASGTPIVDTATFQLTSEQTAFINLGGLF